MSAQQDIETVLGTLATEMQTNQRHASEAARSTLAQYQELKRLNPDPPAEEPFIGAMRVFIGHIAAAMREQSPGSGNVQGNLMLQRMTMGLERMQRSRVIVINDGQGVCVGGRFDGWLMSKHTDGRWVSLKKLDQDDRPESSGPSTVPGSECRVTPHAFASRDLKA